jgi:glycine C-acetyltransferase
MVTEQYKNHLCEQIEALKANGLYKQEREITSPQQARIQIADGRTVLNFCANNYLGLANHPTLIEAA